ncbi:MAG: glutamate-5-semialdehyde dehydrogenase [SAR202 cluster bacterium Io17-Chloro-G2]|nr:MAG: glutamate-5-semialdehyde dehydrogenase [SAR202 cluster bacterium Io17-Chloro-G2]
MAATTINELAAMGRAAKKAARRLARTSTQVKNRALLNISEALEARQGQLLMENERDYTEARANGLSESLLDRLQLTPDRIEGMAAGVRGVAALPDPVGENIDMTTLPNGLVAGRRRVPLGVIGSIYESRPNVTIDIAVLSLKAGNACILRGGKESLHSNVALSGLVRECIERAGLPADAVQYVDNPDRSLVDAMLEMKEYIDLLVPRGGAGLIKLVQERATMPAVTGGIGVCHTYVDRGADLEKATAIVFNAKVRRPSICNALDTLLVHSDLAPQFLPRIGQEFEKAGVELHCDSRALSLLGPGLKVNAIPATEDDWGREYLSLTAAVKVVDSLEEALDHIETYGSGHSEAIVTEDYSAAMKFLDEADAAAVYVNVSTQFTDGAEFGLGAEIGISTQKFHARGPMGLRELTSYKWVVMGNGQVRD